MQINTKAVVNNTSKLFAVIFSTILIYSGVSAQSLKEALRLTENEQYELAGDAYRSLIAKEPQNVNNYYYLGDNYYKAERPDSAGIIFQKGLSIDPNNALCNVGLGKLLLDEQGKTAEANVYFQKALDATKMKDATVMTEVGEALTQASNKDLARALTLLNQALAIDPKNTEILIRIGNVYIEQHNGNLAAEYFNKALDIDPKNLEAILQKGILYYRSTNFEAAGSEFQRAIAIDPSFAPAHRELGETYWKQNKVDLALQEYHKYLDINKGSESARIRYIAFLYLIKQYKEDVEEIARLPKFDSGSVMLNRIAAYSDYEVGDSLHAMILLEHVLKMVPKDKLLSSDYKYYGRALIKTGQDSLGTMTLVKASDMEPTDTELMNEIANLNYKNKRYDDAAAWFRKMIDVKKETTKANDWFMLGKSYFFNKNYENADTAFGKLTELSPKYCSGYLWRAQNLSQLDTSSKEGLAKPHYEKFIECVFADSASVSKNCQQLSQAYSYLYSYYYIVKKDKVNALLYLNKAIDLPCIDPAEKKKLNGVVNQIEHPQPVTPPKSPKK